MMMDGASHYQRFSATPRVPPLVLVAAVASPERFERDLERLIGSSIVTAPRALDANLACSSGTGVPIVTQDNLTDTLQITSDHILLDGVTLVGSRPEISQNVQEKRIQGLIHVLHNAKHTANVHVESTSNGITAAPEHENERHMACIFAVSDRILSAASDLRTLLEPMAESIASTVVLREPNTKRAIVLLRFATNAAANIFVEVYDGQIFDSVNASTFCHVARVSHVYAVGITGPSQSPSGHENNGPQQWRLLPWARGLVELPRCPVCCERIDSTFKPVLYARNRRRIPTGTSQVRRDITDHLPDDVSMAPAWRDMADQCTVCRLLQRRVPTPVGVSPAASSNSSPTRPIALVDQAVPVDDVSRRTMTSSLLEVPSKGANPSGRPADSDKSAASFETDCRVRSSVLRCQTCGETSEKLWVCLLCGFVGCPRPQYGVPGSTSASPTTTVPDANPINRGHMLQHWHDTGYHHNLSVALDTLFIWDYVQDAFVHRASGETDAGGALEDTACNGFSEAPAPRKSPHGVLVGDGHSPKATGVPASEFSPHGFQAGDWGHYGDAAGKTGSHWGSDAWSQSPIQAAAAADTGVVIRDWKIEQITTEYVALLSAQLESQRVYFADMALECRQHADAEITEKEMELTSTQARVDALILELEKHTKIFEARKADLGASEGSLTAMLDKVRTERARRSALMGSAAEHQVKIADIERNAADTLRQHALDADELRQEIADMQKHLASREEIKGASPAMKKELQEGTLHAAGGTDSNSGGQDSNSGGKRRGKRHARGRGAGHGRS